MASAVPFESDAFRQPQHASEAVPGFSLHDQRLFFDPAGALKRKSDIHFLSEISQTRWLDFLPDFGELTGYEVIMVESLHAGLDSRPDEASYANAASLPIADERQREITAWVHGQAERTAGVIVDVADELRQEHTLQSGRDKNIEPLEPPLVLMSMVMAAAAHHGEKRRSGRDYYEHPREMSLMLEAAWHRMFGEHDLSERDRKIASILLHDVEETTIDPKHDGTTRSSGRYVYGPRPLMTPLVIEKAALISGESVDVARRLARINLAITRTRDAKGNKMPYRKVYILRGIELAGADFEIDKVADFHHNRDLEPDPHGRPLMPKRRIRQKQADYNWGQATLFDAAQDEVVGYDLPRLMRYILDTDQMELEAIKAKWAPFDHRDAGKRVHTKLQSGTTLE